MPITINGQPLGDGRKRTYVYTKKTGRPAKPSITEEERAIVEAVRSKGKGRKGSSFDAAAVAISRWRGAHEAIGKDTAEARSVSGRWVRNQLKTGESPSREKVQAAHYWLETGRKSGFDVGTVNRVSSAPPEGGVA